MIQQFLSLLFATTTLFVSCSNQQTQATSTSDTPPLSVEAFTEQMKQQPNAVLVDVRTPEEYAQGHIPEAKNINWKGDFQTEISGISKDKSIFLYCQSGGRSAAATDYLRKSGYKTVYDLDGGIMKWRAENREIVADTVIAKEDSAMSVQQFEALLATDKYVLVDFYATWCGPCRMMEPALEDIAQTMGDKVTVLRIDVDKNEELSKHFEVESLPTVQIYKNKKLVWEDIGYKTKKQLVSQLK